MFLKQKSLEKKKIFRQTKLQGGGGGNCPHVPPVTSYDTIDADLLRPAALAAAAAAARFIVELQSCADPAQVLQGGARKMNSDGSSVCVPDHWYADDVTHDSDMTSVHAVTVHRHTTVGDFTF